MIADLRDRDSASKRGEQNNARKNQTRLQRRHRALLYDDKEQASASRERWRPSKYDPKARKHVAYKEAKIK